MVIDALKDCSRRRGIVLDPFVCLRSSSLGRPDQSRSCGAKPVPVVAKRPIFGSPCDEQDIARQPVELRQERQRPPLCPRAVSGGSRRESEKLHE
jgi:hypothetical protein